MKNSSALVIYNNFINNISEIKKYISKKTSYNGSIFLTILYILSLFFAWCKAPSNINLNDTGVSSGWEELAYINILPLLFIVFKIIKNEKVSINKTIIASFLSLLLFIYNNVINKSVWNNTESETYRFSDNPFTAPTTVSSHTYDVGSDFGVGFWIGMVSIILIILCSISWSFHLSDENDNQSTVEAS